MKIVLNEKERHAGTYYIDFHRRPSGRSIKTICKIWRKEPDGSLSFVKCATSRNWPGGKVLKDERGRILYSIDQNIPSNITPEMDAEFVYVPADKFDRETGRIRALTKCIEKIGSFTRNEKLEIIRQYNEDMERSRRAGARSQAVMADRIEKAKR